jgi:hypothetical protein
MKKLLLLTTILSLNACSATGPVYNGNEQGNVVIYRPQHLFASEAYAPIEINGLKCNLADGGFFITNINKTSEIISHQWLTPGTSRLIIKPGSFIRVEIDSGRAIATVLGGATGNIIHEQSTGSGQYMLSDIPVDIAKQELKGLHEDCAQ